MPRDTIGIPFELIRLFHGEGRESKIPASEKKSTSVSPGDAKEGQDFNLPLLVKMSEIKMIPFENSFLWKTGLPLMRTN